MDVTPPLPPLRRVPPGVWTVVTWGASMAFTFLMRVRLPGESAPSVVSGVLLYRWDGLTFLLAATVLALAGGALLSRRPLPALTLLLAASVVASFPLGVGEIPLAQFLAADVALYFVAATRPRRTGVAAVAMALTVLAGYLAARLLSGWSIGTSAELAVALTAVIAWLGGDSAHRAREYAERLTAQATAQAVTDERLRIARELHDMVAHSIGVIALQAGAARRVIDTQPVRAREALGEIETVGRETLSGLRRTLGVLRRAEPGRQGRGGVLDPGLGLADVDRLAATTTEAGLRVDVRWLGEPRALPAEIDTSAYRIVQEALTNVMRHAGSPSCRVSIGYRREELSIEVVDGGDGRTGAAGSGYGLAGMRERVGLLGGEFSAAPRPEGGFRVAVRLPVPAGVR
ncbi:sensor histidine kinase [Streptosporangium sp. NPDC051022]|uniref:sensor histidine kinase n=1 Tax=Streptosporangium sp. NPDC051022 TaxID=3155752 RepID=UPI003446D7C5